MEQGLAPAAPAAAGETITFPQEPVSIKGPADQPVISPSEAGRILSQFRASLKRVDEQRQSPAAPQEVTPAPESSAQDDAATPIEEPPGDSATPEPNPAEETQPPIEPPRSWPKEKKDAFRNLPREDQEWLADQERTRELDLRKGQNEASEKAKAAEAERQAMAEARTKYEAALPQLLQAMTHDPQFADIKTQADVERLVQEDWTRYVQWDFHQKKIAAVHAELQQAQARQQSEASQKWADFAEREDKAFLEKVPELKDATKAAKARDQAVSLLKDIGFSDQELSGLWNSPALRDHRMQLMLLKAVQLEEAKKQALNATKKQLPPVVRPGVAQPNKGKDEALADLSAKVDRSSGMNQLRAAAQFVAARRKG